MSENETVITTQTEATPSFWARNIWVLLAAGIVLAVALGVALTNLGHTRSEEKQEARVGELEGQLRLAKQRQAEAVDTNTLEALGISASRVKDDGAAIREMLDTAFNWNSGEAFEEARESLKRRFHLSESDDFLLNFLPPSRFNEDSSGKRYYWVDSVGLNVEVKDGAQVEVVRVQGTSYQYAVLADLEFSSDFTDTTGQHGNAALQPTTTRRVLLYVTVDGEGEFSGLHGIPATGLTRHSD